MSKNKSHKIYAGTKIGSTKYYFACHKLNDKLEDNRIVFETGYDGVESSSIALSRDKTIEAIKELLDLLL